MTLVSIPLMDRTGRRTLHLYGLGGMFIFSIFITISFLIKVSIQEKYIDPNGYGPNYYIHNDSLVFQHSLNQTKITNNYILASITFDLIKLCHLPNYLKKYFICLYKFKKNILKINIKKYLRYAPTGTSKCLMRDVFYSSRWNIPTYIKMN